MFLEKLEVYNFRNYIKETIEFSNGLNIIVGQNAQGKTNLLEAIYLLSTGRSPRTVQDKEMINFNAKEARVSAKVVTDIGEREIEMMLSKNVKKRARINGMNIARISELLGNLNTVFFSPDEMRLIKNSPSFRRQFMDIDLCQLSRTYFYTLNKYNKILSQRNALLKQDKDVLNTIHIWTEPLAEIGAKIIHQRKTFCDNISAYASIIHSELTNGKEEIAISYQTTSEGSDEEEIASSLLFDLNKNLERDIKLRYTSVGPHRDDIKIEVDDIDVRKYGSQGQQRTAALSMKLAEIDIFKNIDGENPILLLDDVLSELDEIRREKLLNYSKDIQTILTCTTAEQIRARGKVFLIKNGKIDKK